MNLCIDIHSHLLPGVDDGARDIEETLTALQEYVSQGFTGIILTPHYYPGEYEPDASLLEKKLKEVQQSCRDHNIKLNIYLGCECYYWSGLCDALDSGEVLTMNGSRYVLVEFDPSSWANTIEYGLSDLLRRGYIPILAHFERYVELTDNDLYHLKEMGVLLQMNYEPLRRRDRLFKKNPYRKMVKDGLVDFLGSDCHGTHFRPIHGDEVIAWIEEELEEVEKAALLWANAQGFM